MTYAQRQLVYRMLFWFGFFIVVVCGAYILYEAWLCETSPLCSVSPTLSVTYLMGRCLSQISFHTVCSVLTLFVSYRYLLISGGDRAMLESNPSTSEIQDTAAGRSLRLAS